MGLTPSARTRVAAGRAEEDAPVTLLRRTIYESADGTARDADGRIVETSAAVVLDADPVLKL